MKKEDKGKKCIRCKKDKWEKDDTNPPYQYKCKNCGYWFDLHDYLSPDMIPDEDY